MHKRTTCLHRSLLPAKVPATTAASATLAALADLAAFATVAAFAVGGALATAATASATTARLPATPTANVQRKRGGRDALPAGLSRVMRSAVVGKNQVACLDAL